MTYGHGGRRGVAAKAAAEVVRTVGTGGTALVVGRRRGRAIRRADTRVVLGTSPGETNARVADGVALHLVDCHLGGMAVYELDETAALTGRDLDIGDFSEALEEGTEFILGDVSGQTTDKDSGVVRVGELVHLGGGLHSSVALVRIKRTRLLHAPSHTRLHARVAHHGTAVTAVTAVVVGVVVVGATIVTIKSAKEGENGVLGYPPLLRRSSADTHRAVTTVNTLHLHKSALLITLVGETNKSVAAGLASGSVGHDLGALAGREARLEQGNQNVLGNFGAKITNEDREFRAAVVASMKLVKPQKDL